MRAGEELNAYVSDMITERRADPRDDLLSDMIAIEQEGDRLSTEEMAMLAQAVLMAGTDTTRNQLACSVALFTEYPDQWALLAERPELAGRAVEESMRYLGAVRGTARVASEDVVYRDVLFPQGTLVAISLSGANRDPEAFDEPNDFDITRERGTAQMTFGAGIHFCMGAALARAELQEALPLLARRMPGLARSGDIEWKPSTFGIWGPARLPLSFENALTPTPLGQRRGGLADELVLALRVGQRHGQVHQLLAALFPLAGHDDLRGEHFVGPGLAGEANLIPRHVPHADVVRQCRPQQAHGEHAVPEDARLPGGLGRHLVVVHRVEVTGGSGVLDQVGPRQLVRERGSLVTHLHVVEGQLPLTHRVDLLSGVVRAP